MRNLGPTELILVLLVILLLFGWKRLPDMSRSMGRSLRIFKSEIKELKDDEGTAAAPTPADPTAATTPSTTASTTTASSVTEPVKPTGQPPTP